MQPGDYATTWQDVLPYLLGAVTIAVVLTWYIVFVQRRRRK